MKRDVAALASLLIFGLLTLWVDERWAWSLFQTSVFVLAGWRIVRCRRWHPTAALGALAAAALWPLLQLLVGASVSRFRTWNAALDWFTFLVLFALAGEILADGEARRWFLRAAALFGMALAAVATAQKYSSGGRIFWLLSSGYQEDVLGPFVNRNQYAAWIELLLPVALWLAATDRRFRTLYGTSAAVMFGSVVASASRAGFALASAETLAVLVAAAWRRTVSRRVLALGAVRFVAITFIATAVLGWQGLWSRWQERTPEVLRADALRASLAMVHDRPWTGSGLGTWSTVYPRYAGIDTGLYLNQAHNDWAQWATEGGLPFVLVVAVFAGLLCKPAIQSIYGLGTVAFLLHGLVDYPMQQRPGLAAWFFVLAAAAMAWRAGVAAGLSANDELLRGVRAERRGLDGADPPGIQASGEDSAPRPVP